MRLAYNSKHNFKRKGQVILSMITDGKKWYYLVVKLLQSLVKGITSNHDGGFYCLNCFHSYRTKNKLPTKKSFHYSGRILVEFHWNHGK